MYYFNFNIVLIIELSKLYLFKDTFYTNNNDFSKFN